MKKVGSPDLRPMREKTLEELEGFVAGDPPYDTYLVRVVQQIRRIGIDRMLFGIDQIGTPGQAWESLIRFPFTRDELARIATNLAPWLRPQVDR